MFTANQKNQLTLNSDVTVEQARQALARGGLNREQVTLLRAALAKAEHRQPVATTPSPETHPFYTTADKTE